MNKRIIVITLVLVLLLLSLPLMDLSRYLIGVPESVSDDDKVMASDGYGEGPHTISVGPLKAFSMVDQKERAVKYVRVKAVTPDGDVYVERTDIEGNAYFLEMPFEEFPDGTVYSIRSFTFTDPTWTHGEEIPLLENDHREFLTFGSIVYLIPILIFIFLFLLTRIRMKKKDSD